MATRKYPKKRELGKSETVAELPLACADESAARAFLERKRWGDQPCCPHCGSVEVYRITGEKSERRGLLRCRDCKKQFTVRVGTIFEDSAIPLHKWCRAMWEASSAKNGVSALEMSRKLQITHKSALFMMHRLRWAMADDHTTPPKLTGTVEADETYVGGKPRLKGWSFDDWKLRRAKWSTKTRVVAVLQRGGAVRSEVTAGVNARNIRQVLLANIHPSARLITDEHTAYRRVGPAFASHETVTHSKGEYARGDVTTNTVESYFARIKRGLHGTYHAVSKEHLHRYVSQFEWLHNTRRLTDGERAEALIRKTVGKRLTYHEPTRNIG